MSASEDRQAVQAVLAGDASAFEGIVERWQGPLVNLAYRFCRDRAQAEDLAQDAFVRIFRALKSYRGEAEFSTWLLAVATNVYRSQLRRMVPELASLEQQVALAETAAEPISEDDREELVRGAVKTLPAKYREAIVLFYFQDMDIAKASSALGVPSGTLKARLFRARAMLEARLRAMFGALSPEES
jgi:RNA polymerase sigma-70 factor (ECF subfamily)